MRVSISIYSTETDPRLPFTVRFIPAAALPKPGLSCRYAIPLITQMGGSNEENRSAFIAFASALDTRRARIELKVNKQPVSPVDPADWPSNWRSLDLIIRSAQQVIEQSDIAQMHQMIVDLLITMFGMLSSLIGVEDIASIPAGEAEGRSLQTLTTRYERKKINREACIQLKGLRCAACGFDFSRFYGSLGVGYIEVHHLIPVSRLGSDYRINVATDLEPICSNCHAMVHREEPPVSIARLREIVRSSAGK